MKQLSQILKRFEHLRVVGEASVQISSLSINSKQITQGAAFVAIKGCSVDSHIFIQQAIHRGAKVIICEDIPEKISQNTTYVQVKDSAKALGFLSSLFYDEPSKKLKVIGVTGTNGKTTTVTLLYQLFEKLGYKSGLLSTIQYKVSNKRFQSTHTTPNAITLNYLLNEMIKEKCQYCFMEVSSHSIVQHRISGIIFQGGIFTNISHEHLDYHKTFENYRTAKQQFFSSLPKNAFALFNIDDNNSSFMFQNCLARKYSFSLRSPSDFQCIIQQNSLKGLKILLNKSYGLCSPLIGQFNAYNLTGVFAAALLLKQQPKNILSILCQSVGAEGRFTPVHNQKGPIGIVDFAHTPDALKKVLITLNQIRKKKQKILTVIGCGGNRDKQKRPMMASISSKLSDYVILTSDNPRFEDLKQILKEMMAGIEEQDKNRVKVIDDREQAIREAWRMANGEDVILVAGKGHEKYQQIKGIKYPFNDMEVLRSLWREKQVKN